MFFENIYHTIYHTIIDQNRLKMYKKKQEFGWVIDLFLINYKRGVTGSQNPSTAYFGLEQDSSALPYKKTPKIRIFLTFYFSVPVKICWRPP